MARTQTCTPSARKRPAAKEVAKPHRVRGTPTRASPSGPASKRLRADETSQGRASKRSYREAMSRGPHDSASNSPSEDAETPSGVPRRTLSRQRPGGSELGGTFSFFMKRAQQMEGSEASEGFHAPFGLGSSSSSQFSPLLRDLKSEDGQKQLLALTELAEQLSFSSEEALISFPMETFIPLLINLLGNPGNGDEITAQVMLLACRCLFNVVDILPPTARIIVGHGGLSVLCANLLNIEYIDVAELTVSIIELISEDQPLQVLKAGGLEAILSFLDFFQISVQRQAANAAAAMLRAVPPPDVFNQQVKPALPTLAQLLQHSDPQVLYSICEGWRRVIDGCIAAHEQPKQPDASSVSGASASLVSRFAAQARLRFGSEGTKRDAAEEDEEDEDEEDEEDVLPPPSPVVQPISTESLAASLQDMIPSSVLSNLLLLLGNGISSTPQTSVVVAEVLYILSVLTNYSHNFTEEVLKQDICGLLGMMVLGMDLVGTGVGSAQGSSLLIRVLALVASVMPSVLLTESGCVCEERRLMVFRQHPEFLDALSKTFLPMLIDICQASMDPSVQSVCISLLLTFALASQERPELQKNLEPVQLASFLASLLLTEPSTSVTLSCLLIGEQTLRHHYDVYALHFIRQGVRHAISNQASADSEQPTQEHTEAIAADAAGATSAAAPSVGKLLRRLCKEVAQRTLQNHFDSRTAIEMVVLDRLKEVAQQLESQTSAAQALQQLRSLLLAEESVTAFELTCSGVSSALSAYLFPECDDADVFKERLRLFLEHIVTPPGGALQKLVKLCVSVLQRVEQGPLNLFPTQASPAMYLPQHLLLATSQAADARSRRVDPMDSLRLSSSRSGIGSMSSPLLSVLRLLAKPVKIRMSPRGSSSGVSPLSASLPNFKSLLVPFGGLSEGAEGRNKAVAKASALIAGAPGRVPAGPRSGPGVGVSAASPAARLRNYLASKVTRKRGGGVVGGGVFRSEAKSGGPGGETAEDGGPVARASTGEGSGSRSAREREFEALETVLLVEPFAQVSALEDYIWDRHGSGKPAAAEGAETGTTSEPAARVRLTTKQPPPGQAASRARAKAGELGDDAKSAVEPGAASPPAVPLDAPAAPPPLGQSSSQGGDTPSSNAQAPASTERRKQTVRIFYNGHQLTAKESVVQVLVNNPKKASPVLEEMGKTARRRQSRRSVGGRFLASMEESSGSDGEGSPGKASASRHFFCGSIWGKVHHMTFELVPDPTSPREGGEASKPEELQVDPPVMIVPNEMDCLVQCHTRVAPSVAGICDAGGGTNKAPSFAQETETVTMLQLLSAFHNISLYDATTSGVQMGSVSEDFHCNTLTSALLRQLSDPLAVCTGSVPAWCAKLAGACRFLFPYSVRRILHQSCNLGLGRALHHVQQRAVAQHAHNQETHRRLESEVSVASVPRQKVRISRQRLLDSAVKVMNLYSAGNALLEIEYAGEVGTGSGPTLEFYALVAENLRTLQPQLFRASTPGGMLYPQPYDPHWLRRADEQGSQQILERFRLLGQVVAKCIIDNRLVDIQLHPAFWRSVLGSAPLSQQWLRSVDPELHSSLENIRDMDADKLEGLCIDFTMPGHPSIELKPGGAGYSLNGSNREEYLRRVAEVALVEAVAPQINAFRTAFKELLPLETCRIWSEQELSFIIVGSSVQDDAFWCLDHLAANIKAHHGYTTDSRCFKDLMNFLSELSAENRRNFLMFATGAPTLPIGGFSGLKPPLTVVKKEAPSAPLTADDFMPSVMTCANYLKLPEYSSAEMLKQKLQLAMREGQCAFLLS